MRAEYLEIKEHHEMIEELRQQPATFWQSDGVAIGDQRIADLGRLYRDDLIEWEYRKIAVLQQCLDLSARE